MPSTYELIADAMWPAKLMVAIVCAYLVHQWVGEKFIDGDDDDDGGPPGFV